MTFVVKVVISKIFAGETFHDDHHHIFCARDHGNSVGGGGIVHRGENEFHHLVGEVVGVFEGFLAESPYDGEGCVEDDGSLPRGVDVLIGVADGDGTGIAGETASHGEYRHRDGNSESDGLDNVIVAAIGAGLLLFLSTGRGFDV